MSRSDPGLRRRGGEPEPESGGEGSESELEVSLALQELSSRPLLPHPPEGPAQTLPIQWLRDFHHLAQPHIHIPLSPRIIAYLLDPTLQLPPPSSSRTMDQGHDFGQGGFMGSLEGAEVSPSSSTTSWGSGGSGSLIPPGLESIFVTPTASRVASRVTVDGDAGEEEEEEEEESETEEDPILGLGMEQAPPEMREELENLVKVIGQGIQELGGGGVMPKVNWKAPRDAKWMALNHSLKCSTADDVLLLLKHSQAIENVLKRELPEGTEHTLTLFEWDDHFGPDLEFRCFIRNRKLVLICQRDPNQAYPGIVQARDAIVNDIHIFFRRNIRPKLTLRNYVMDIMRARNKLTLIDLNVYGAPTEPGLTSWDELKDLEAQMLENIKQIQNGNERTGLRKVAKYGEPFFRYGTEAVIATPNPDLQAPVNMDLETFLLRMPISGDGAMVRNVGNEEDGVTDHQEQEQVGEGEETDESSSSDEDST